MTDDGAIWKTFKKSVEHTLIGTLMFLVLALAAVGLAFVVKGFTRIGVDWLLVLGLRIAEYTLFIVDWALFTILILRVGIQLLRSIWDLK